MPLPVYLYLIPVDNPSQKLVENDHYKTRQSLKKIGHQLPFVAESRKKSRAQWVQPL